MNDAVTALLAMVVAYHAISLLIYTKLVLVTGYFGSYVSRHSGDARERIGSLIRASDPLDSTSGPHIDSLVSLYDEQTGSWSSSPYRDLVDPAVLARHLVYVLLPAAVMVYLEGPISGLFVGWQGIPYTVLVPGILFVATILLAIMEITTVRRRIQRISPADTKLYEIYATRSDERWPRSL